MSTTQMYRDAVLPLFTGRRNPVLHAVTRKITNQLAFNFPGEPGWLSELDTGDQNGHVTGYVSEGSKQYRLVFSVYVEEVPGSELPPLPETTGYPEPAETPEKKPRNGRL